MRPLALSAGRRLALRTVRLMNRQISADGTALARSREETVRGKTMDEDSIRSKKPSALAFECESCGEHFETWDLLRQHQVDCQTDDFEIPV